MTALEAYYDNLESLIFDDGIDTLTESLKYSLQRICSESTLVPIREGFVRTILSKIKAAIDRVIKFIKKLFNTIRSKLFKSSGSSSKSGGNSAAQKAAQSANDLEKNLNDLENSIKNPGAGSSSPNKGSNEKKTTGSSSAAKDNMQKKSEPDAKSEDNESSSNSEPKVYTKRMINEMIDKDKRHNEIFDRFSEIVKEKDKIIQELKDLFNKFGEKYGDGKDETKSLYIDRMGCDPKHIKRLHSVLPDNATIKIKVNNGLAGYLIGNTSFYNLFKETYGNETADRIINMLNDTLEKAKDPNFSGNNVWDIITDCDLSSSDSEKDISLKIAASLLVTFFTGKTDSVLAKKSYDFISSRRPNSDIIFLFIDGADKFWSVNEKEITLKKDVLLWCSDIAYGVQDRFRSFENNMNDSFSKLQSKIMSAANNFDEDANANIDPKYRDLFEDVINSIGGEFFSKAMDLTSQLAQIINRESRVAGEIIEQFYRATGIDELKDKLDKLNKEVTELKKEQKAIVDKYASLEGKPIKESYFDIDFR